MKATAEARKPQPGIRNGSSDYTVRAPVGREKGDAHHEGWCGGQTPGFMNSKRR